MFVGRDAELAVVRGVLDQARAGAGSSLVVAGPAGIGKTHLVDQALRELDGDLTVHRAACGELERDIPFATIGAALGLRRSSTESAEASLAALIGDPAGGDLRFRIVDDVVDLLERRAMVRAIVLVLDDIQRADPGTLLVAKRLTRDAALRPVALICTRRPFPPRAEVDDALDGATTFTLDALTDPDVETLATHVLGAAPDRSLLGALAACGGNPLYATELLAALRSDDRVAEGGGRASLLGGEVPGSLRLTILAQLSFLGDEAVSLLRTAACFGSTFDVRDIALLLECPAAEIIRILDPMVRAALVGSADDLMTFRHDLVRDAIYEDMPASMRVALHAEIARRLGDDGRPVTERAPHVLLSARDGDVSSVELLRDAARVAGPLSATIAAALLERATGIAPSNYAHNDTLTLELATALSDAGRQQDAEELARSVLAGHPDARTAQRARRLVVHTLMLRERARDAVDVLEAMAGDQSLTGVERARVLATTARAWSQTGEVEHTRSIAAEALTLADAVDDGEARCQALWAIGWLEATFGDPLEVFRVVADAVELVRRGDVETATRAEVAWGYLYVFGILETTRAEARAFVHEEAQQAEAAGHLWVVSMLHEMRGFDHVRWGELDDARREASAAIQAAEDIGSWRFLSSAYATLARAAIYTDDLDAAAKWLDAAEASATQEDNLAIAASRTFQPRYEYEEARGRPDLALAFLWDAFERLQLTLIGGYTFAVHSPQLVRLLLAAGRDVEARRVLQWALDMEAAWAGTGGYQLILRRFTLHIRGLLDRDCDILLAAVAEHRALRAGYFGILAALEDAAEVLAEQDRREQAVALLEEALDAWASVGAPRPAARLTARLRELGVQRGVTGARGRPATGWDALTQAELRVADLVAEGLTYREVAERLFLSRRTVESHVARMFTKLDLASRRDLAREVLARRE